MKNNKLFSLFALLKVRELKNLRKAVLSPLWNSDKKIIILYDGLMQYAPSYEISKKDKLDLYAKMFPGEKYTDLKWRLAISGLVKITQRYIVHLQLKQNELAEEKLLSDFFAERNEYNFFQKTILRRHDLTEQMPVKNSAYWLEKMQIYDALYTNSQHDKYDKSDRTPENLTDAADRFFAFAKVRYGLALKSKSEIFAAEYPTRFRAAITAEFEKGLLSDNDLFALYLAAEQLTDRGDTNSFRAYEQLFFANAEKIVGEDRLFLFFIGLNYAVRQLNQGDSEMRRTPLRWYKFGLKNGILIEDGLMSPITFSNIVTYGCADGEEKQTLSFIRKYGKHLPDDIRRDELTYSTALVVFHQKNYIRVIDLLETYSFSKNYIFKTRSLLLISYSTLYLQDNKYYDLLIAAITAYEYYLLRDKTFAGRKKEPHLNFCKLLRKIVKLRRKHTEPAKISARVQKELDKPKSFIAKKWLMRTFVAGEQD